MTHHCHSKSIVYIRTNSWCCVVPYIVLDKCIMPYMHHYNILQSSFIALKILLLLPSQSLLISGNLIFLMLPEFLTLWVFVLLFFLLALKPHLNISSLNFSPSTFLGLWWFKSQSSNSLDSMVNHFYLPFSLSSKQDLLIFSCVCSNTTHFSANLITYFSLPTLESHTFNIHWDKLPGMSPNMKLFPSRLCSGEVT